MKTASTSKWRPLGPRHAGVGARLDLVDQVGTAGLTMRKLGAALGVEAMTLYY